MVAQSPESKLAKWLPHPTVVPEPLIACQGIDERPLGAYNRRQSGPTARLRAQTGCILAPSKQGRGGCARTMESECSLERNSNQRSGG